MSATSALESNEDLENIPLVRMADVQPDRTERYSGVKKIENRGLNDFVCHEEDLSTASMVSVKTEDNIVAENPELIIPDVVKPYEEPMTIIIEQPKTIKSTESWPTLEILPGGVIRHADKYEEDLSSLYKSGDLDEADTEDDKMYACAKCQQRFKFLFSLVKHVKRHEDQTKKEKCVETKICNNMQKNKFICLQHKKKVISKLKTKCKVPKKS